jgi:hypothetical protein
MAMIQTKWAGHSDQTGGPRANKMARVP